MKYIEEYKIFEHRLDIDQLKTVNYTINEMTKQYIEESGKHTYFGKDDIEAIYEDIEDQLSYEGLQDLNKKEQTWIKKLISNVFISKGATSYYNSDSELISYYTKLFNKSFDYFKDYYFFVNRDLQKDKKNKVADKIDLNLKVKPNKINDYILKIITNNISQFKRYMHLVSSDFKEKYNHLFKAGDYNFF